VGLLQRSISMPTGMATYLTISASLVSFGRAALAWETGIGWRSASTLNALGDRIIASPPDAFEDLPVVWDKEFLVTS
jgi:hypothetical protein